MSVLFCRLLICILILQLLHLQGPTTKQETFHHLPTQEAMSSRILTTGQMPPPTTDQVPLQITDQMSLPTTDQMPLRTTDQMVECLM